MDIATRRIAANIAGALANDPSLADATGKLPRVHLDACTSSPPLDGTPFVIVSGLSAEGLRPADASHTVAVVIAIDASAVAGNAVDADRTPRGFFEFGAGDSLVRLAEAVADRICATKAGAILEGMDAEFSFASLPIQYCTLTLSYSELKAFGD